MGVDARHFHAVDNTVVGKYDRSTGRLRGPNRTPCGRKAHTMMVKFDREFRPLQGCTLPKGVLDRFEDMIYGIVRATAKERQEDGSHKVTVHRLVERP